MKRTAGFTLLEVLAVIAIIAILAAIIFPVYSRAKDSAYRSDDMAAMNQLRSAIQLYYVDQGGYPPALLGYATLYASGPNIGQVIPADRIQSYLFPKRVGSLNSFQPAYNRSDSNDMTTAVYPQRDARPLGSPIADLDGNGTIDAADDVCGARQRYGPGSGFVAFGGGVTNGGMGDPPVANFYNLSGYDVAEVPDVEEQDDEPCDPAVPYTGTPGTRFELRYTLFWTDFALNQNGNSADDPRQLGYGYPPDDTIITWNSYFRDLDRDKSPKNGNRDIILFLGGSAKMFDSRQLHDRSWRTEVAPKAGGPGPVGTGGTIIVPD